MKYRNMSHESVATLSIFVNQLSSIIDSDKTDSCKINEIRETLALWVSANDLHPEEVGTLDQN